MHCNYRDIRERIQEEPEWWDERAVPRYCPFSPERLANIYADEAALVLIACQYCDHTFKVAFSSCNATRIIPLIKHELYGIKPEKEYSHTPIADAIKDGSLFYGDPPNIGCCGPGPTMTADVIRVLEYWNRRKTHDWVRDHSLEIRMED